MGTRLEVRLTTVIWTATVAVLSIAATLIVASAWSADAAPGDSDTTYVATAGCRAFDLRPAPNQVGPRPTPLGAGEVYTQQITGDVGECTGPLAIPSDAVAVAMNVTAVGPTAQTNLRLFPANLTDVPTLSNLNVSAGQAPFPNKVDVALSPGGAIKIFNQNGFVSVLGDIVGYYTNSSLSDLDTRLAAVEVNDAIQDQALAELAAEQPFLQSKGSNTFVDLDTDGNVLHAMDIVAPADGHVIAFSTTRIGQAESFDGTAMRCRILGDPDDGLSGVVQEFEQDDASNNASLSGSNVFAVTEGTTLTITLRCDSDVRFGYVEAWELSAIFTPAR